MDQYDGNTLYNITFEGDHNTITIPDPIYKLANDAKIAKVQREIVRPLKAKGIDVLQFRDADIIVDTITKSDVDSFYVREVAEDLGLSSQTIEAILTLRAAVFVPGERWQFFYGETRLSADISDQRFLSKVFVDGERFGVGDKLLVKLRIAQRQTPTGQIRNDYEIMDVLQIWPSGKQISFPLAACRT